MGHQSFMATTPADLLMPGIMHTLGEESKGLPVSMSRDIDKITFKCGAHTVAVTFDSMRRAVENDRYESITNAVKGAVRYLRAMTRGNNHKKARAFRTKRRSILARR